MRSAHRSLERPNGGDLLLRRRQRARVVLLCRKGSSSDLLTILLIVLIVLALSSVSYGYYTAPVGVGPAPWVTPLGVITLLLIIGLIVMLLTGWRFDIGVTPPPAR